MALMLRKPVDASKPLCFKIKEDHVVVARCSDPSKCVIAQALNDALGDFFEGVEVGMTVVKIYTAGKETRYSTPNKLRRAIPVFDKTGQWNLPPGEYTLLPPSPTVRLGARPGRWKVKHKKKTKPGRDMFRGRALPTRRISRSGSTLCVV
jgi:hypothetical protein